MARANSRGEKSSASSSKKIVSLRPPSLTIRKEVQQSYGKCQSPGRGEERRENPSLWGHGHNGDFSYPQQGPRSAKTCLACGCVQEREQPSNNRPWQREGWKEAPEKPSQYGRSERANVEESNYRGQTNLGSRNRLARRRGWGLDKDNHKLGHEDHEAEERMVRLARRNYFSELDFEGED